MTHVIGRGRYARAVYPIGGLQKVGQVPNEIARYAFDITTAMAGKTMVPVANQLGAPAQDQALPTNFTALLFTVPGGRLSVGDLVVLSGGGNTGSKIDLQFATATVSAPVPVPAGSLKVGVIDPTQPGGVVGSQIDCSDVVIPAGGAVLVAEFIIPGNVVINTPPLRVSLSVGVLWNPASILLPPA